MRYDYLIEIRPFIEKLKLKRKMRDLKTELRLRKTPRVPHITLVYKFRPKIQNYKLAELIKETASKYDDLSFEYNGWELEERKEGYVFGFKIKPSDELREFRYELYHNIKNSIIEDPRTKKFNELPKDKFWFHTSIAIHQDKTKAERIDDFINKKETLFDKLSNFLKGKDSRHTKLTGRPLTHISEVQRIPLLRSGKITYEYDKFTNRKLNRHEALSKKYKRATLAAYRKKKGIEVIPNDAKDSKSQTWFISDTHFDHSNIIGFCARPFADVNEMNNILVDNWNNTVKKQDRVYFLGDIAFGRGSRPKDQLLPLLNGEIVFILGDHDKDKGNTKLSDKLEYKGQKFLLIHDPNEKPSEWDDWIIHGHIHNNDLANHPLINNKQKTVNVSVELIKYRPISFDKIIELIENTKEVRAQL